MSKDKKHVALIRGNSLTDWEGKLWENLPEDFIVEGFCTRKNLYPTHLNYPVNILRSTVDGFILNNVSKYCFGFFQKMYGLEQYLRNFDIAHTAEIYYGYTSQAVSAKKINPKLKVVCTVWDNSPDRFEFGYWPGLEKSPQIWINKMKKIISANAEGVDLFLPVTRGSAELLQSYGVEDSKIHVLSPGLFPYEKPDDNKTREKFNLMNKKVFLSVNRLVKEKGIYDILYVWKDLPKEFLENKVLIMIGSGPEKKTVEHLVKKWHFEDKIILIDSLQNSEIQSLHAISECLILASHATQLWQEQFGYVLAEAMRVGTPVLATSSGAIPEVVGNGGILFQPENREDLKNKLFKLAELRAYLAIEAKKQSEKYGATRFQNELVQIYESVLK